MAKVTNLSQHIADADLVITGEGKLDAQSAMGKVAGGISHIAKASHAPVIAICGSIDGLQPAQTSQFEVIMPSIQKLESIDNVFKNAYHNIEITAANIAAAIKLGQRIK